MCILRGDTAKQTDNFYDFIKTQHHILYIEILEVTLNIIFWPTCSSNELMCHRYSLSTSRRHPASSTSSSPGSSLDRAVSAETTCISKTWTNTASSQHSYMTSCLYIPLRSWSSVVDSRLSLHDWIIGDPEKFSSHLMNDGHAAKPWSKEFRKQVLPRFNRPGTIPVGKHESLFIYSIITSAANVICILHCQIDSNLSFSSFFL